MKKELFVIAFSIVLMSFQTEAKIIRNSGTSCDGKCTVYYDSETRNLTIEKNPDVPDGEEVILPKNWEIVSVLTGKNNYQSKDDYFNNVTVGEGITGCDAWCFTTYYNTSIKGTLTLPSTFKSTSNLGTSATPFWNIDSETVDVSALKDTGISLNTGSVKNVILSEGSNVKVGIIGATNYGLYPSNVNIQCKGTDLTSCENMIMNLKKDTDGNPILKYGSITATIKTDYFKGEENGKYVEWCETGKKVFDLPNGDYRFYDKDGKYVGSFLPDGSKRRIYAIDEAVAVTEKGGKNTFSIRYR